MLNALLNLPPEVLPTEEQHFASSPLQRSLHFLNAAGEVELLNAAGTQYTLPGVNPEPGPYEKKVAIIKLACSYSSTDRVPFCV